jgi:hypothetical protein
MITCRIRRETTDSNRLIGSDLRLTSGLPNRQSALCHLEDALRKEPDQVVPYKILLFAVESVKQVARSRMRLFNGAGSSWSSVKSA